MKGLSLKRIVSFVVVAAMLLALLAVPAMADEKVITVTHANVYDSANYSTVVIAWATATEGKTVETLYSDGSGITFGWWYHALLELNAETGLYEVTKTEVSSGATGTGATEYATWTLGTGKVVLSAHADNATESALNVKALAEPW